MTITIDKKAKYEEIINEASNGLSLQLDDYHEKVFRIIEEHMSTKEVNEVLVKTALENIDEAQPDWTFFASRLYTEQLYEEAATNRQYQVTQAAKYGDFYQLIEMLTEKGIYTTALLEKYSREDIIFLGTN